MAIAKFCKEGRHSYCEGFKHTCACCSSMHVTGIIPRGPKCHECGKEIENGDPHIAREVFDARFTWHLHCGFLNKR